MKFWLFWIALFFLPLTGISKTVIEEIEADKNVRKLSCEEYLVNSVLAMFAPEKLPAAWQLSSYKPAKCGAGIMLQVKENWDLLSAKSQQKILQYSLRPDSTIQYISQSGRFKVHYYTEGRNAVDAADDDLSGIPDFVEEAARALDYSYRLLVDTLGYNPPPGDGGRHGPEYDFYFLNMGGYGDTQPETEITHSPTTYSSFIRCNNKFGAGFATHGLDAVRVTCAHEFFHTVQLGYAYRGNDLFYFEMSSVWIEDVAYDYVNDYYAYLPNFFQNTNVPFDEYNGIHEYGACIWNHMLAKKFGRNIIRNIWENIARFPAIEAMDNVLINFSDGETSFKRELEAFSIWNYFTGQRSNPVEFYPEGAEYPEVTFRRSYTFDTDVALTDSIHEFAAAYYSVSDPLNERDFAVVMQHLTPPTNDTRRVKYNLNVLRYPLSKSHQPVDKNLYVQINASELVNLRGNVTIAYYNGSNKIQSFSPVTTPKIPPIRIFPNPYVIGQDADFQIDFILEQREWVEIKILTFEGRLIKNIVQEGILPGFLDEGFHPEAKWDGTNEDGYYVSSGIYLVCIKTDSFVEYRKFSVIRK